MSSGERYGFDLGTTNSVLAMLRTSGLHFFQNRQGDDLTPSWVTRHEGEWLVGSPARDISVLAPESSVFSAKRLMGRNFRDPKVQQALENLPYKIKPARANGEGILIEIEGEDHEPQDIGAMVLRKMKEDTEFLNPGSSVDQVVITVPAYFNESQRAATMEAGRRAGLTVLALLPEPSAAALAYGTDPETHDGRLILVYDLGGGTFDVTAIMASDGDFITQGLDGDMWLGGDDFDQRIVDQIVEHIRETHEKDPTTSRSSMMEIKKRAEQAKINLSNMEQTEIQTVLPDLGNILVRLRISRRPKCPGCGKPCVVSARATGLDEQGEPAYEPVAECPDPGCGRRLEGEAVQKTFEGAIVGLVQRTLDLTNRALTDNGITEEELDQVLMVGGSTFTPLVREKVRERFGPAKVRFEVDPMRCVSQGSAIYALHIPERIRCPRCGAMNDVDAAKCVKCEYEFEERTPEERAAAAPSGSPCPNCHTEIPADKQVCPKCGYRIGAFTGSTAQAYGCGLVGGRYGVVIPRGATYPMVNERDEVEGIARTFYTDSDNQRLVDVPVYCGDVEDDVTQNDLMGHILVTMEKPVPKNTPVEVTFALDRNQLLQVTVEVKGGGAGSRATAVLEPTGSAVSDATGVLDRIAYVRQQSGPRMTPEAESKLAQAESDAVGLAGNHAISSANKRDEIEAIKEKIEAIANELGVAQAEQPEWVSEAIGSVNWANLAVHKIGDLLDADDAKELQELSQALQRALDIKAQDKAEALTARIDQIIHDLERVASLALFAYLNTFRVERSNPGKAQELREGLDKLVPRLARGSFEAEKELSAIVAEIREIIDNVQQIPCPKGCGHMISESVEICPYCHERVKTFIRGDKGPDVLLS